MKLKGSLTEESIRKELSKANLATSESAETKEIFSYLSKLFPNVHTSYSLNWIYEQDIEILKILIDSCFVITIQINRSDNSYTLVEKLEIDQYKKGLKRKDQLKLLVALDLAKQFGK